MISRGTSRFNVNYSSADGFLKFIFVDAGGPWILLTRQKPAGCSRRKKSYWVPPERMSTYPWTFHVEWFRWLRKTREGHQTVTLNIPGDLRFAFWIHPVNSHRARIFSLKVHWAINFIHKFKNNYPGERAALCFNQGVQIPSTLLFAAFWRQNYIDLRLASNLLCAWGWLWTPDPDPPASAPPVLELRVCTTLPSSIFRDLVFPLLPGGKSGLLL